MNKTKVVCGIVFLLLFSLLSSVSSAQLGEFAGQIHFNVSAGESQTLHMTIFDSSTNASVRFEAFSQITAIPNMTSPTITLSPKSGVLQPRQNILINITVYMPLNAKPGTTWTAIVQVIQVANQTVSSGATIQSGVAKIITITAQPLKINYLELAFGGIVVIGVSFGAYYSILRRRAKAAKVSARRKRALKRVAKRITPKKKARAKRRTKHRRTTRRRKR